MYRFTVDYSKDRPDRRVLMDRGFFAHDLPRLILRCRLTGHQPVVDGYDSQYGREEHRRARWVICGRCGIRPTPQGTLDPDRWDLGQRYTGKFIRTRQVSPDIAKQLAHRGIKPAHEPLPGAWPATPSSAVGAQVIIGRALTTGIEIKVGSRSSEQCLAAHVSLGPLGAIYVHTEDHGRFLQSLLNPGRRLSAESRVTGIDFHRGRFEWKLWANRDSSSRDDPWWMRGSIPIDPRHYLLGRKTCDIDKLSAKTAATVTMPDGVSYEVLLRLERLTYGRIRGRKIVRYDVDWDCRAGIPVSFKDTWNGSSVTVSADGLDNGQWVQEACAGIVNQLAKQRARYNYQPPEATETTGRRG